MIVDKLAGSKNLGLRLFDIRSRLRSTDGTSVVDCRMVDRHRGDRGRRQYISIGVWNMIILVGGIIDRWNDI